MEIGMRVTAHVATLAVTTGGSSPSHVNSDLRSIAECVSVALERVTFTPEEIEGVLALANDSWQSLRRP
jgi:hypothetical protein